MVVAKVCPAFIIRTTGKKKKKNHRVGPAITLALVEGCPPGAQSSTDSGECFGHS